MVSCRLRPKPLNEGKEHRKMQEVADLGEDLET